MFWEICKQDWKIIKRGKLAGSAMILLMVFICIAGWIGNHYAATRTALIEKIKTNELSALETAGNLVDSLQINNLPFKGNSHRDPTTANGAANGMGARYLVLPPSPMMIISIGQSDLYANYYKFGLNKKQALYHEAEILNPVVVFNGYFDLSFVIIYILPLIIIACSYNIISSEKEQGTFRLLFNSSISPKKIFLIKYAFRLILLYLFTIGLIFLILVFSKVNISDAAYETGILFFEIFWYMAFWMVISLIINLLNFRSGTNAAILSGIWLLLLITFPAILNIIARKKYPMPSRLELIAETREASDSARNNMNLMLSGFMEDHPELVPEGSKINPNDFAVVSLRSGLAVEEAIRPLEQEFSIKKAEQEALLKQFGILSPGIRLQIILNNIAGTGEERYNAFRASMEEEHDKFRAYFAKKILAGEPMQKEDYQQIPQPVFIENEKNQINQNLAFPVILTIVCFAFALGLFRKLTEIAAEA